MKRSFENLKSLEIYYLSKKLVLFVYELTDNIPKEEKYGLISQMRKCSLSIAANVAEGYGRFTKMDEHRFMKIARGSLYELFLFTEIIRELCYVNKDQVQALEGKIFKLSIKLGNYMTYLRNK